jgi:hypothetical protein
VSAVYINKSSELKKGRIAYPIVGKLLKKSRHALSGCVRTFFALHLAQK